MPWWRGLAALRLFGILERLGIPGRRDLDCGEVRDLASDYLDGDVDGSLRGRIVAHLERCGLCRAFVESLRATVSLLGSLERAEPPQSLINLWNSLEKA